MTLCMFAVMIDSEDPVWCVLCGAKFINIFALDKHFLADHNDFDAETS
jgi:hypothetical protein